MSDASMSRRHFLRAGALGGAALGLAGVGAGEDGGPPTIRCGCIGVGGRGTVLLNQALKIPKVVFPAICDINEGNLNRALGIVEKAQGKRPEGYRNGPEDYRNLLRREDLDAVIIATPCHLHAPMYLDAMEAGKHLYGEKPMCLTVKEANRIVSVHEQRARNLVVQIGFQRRANPRYQEAIALIHRGEIGEPVEGRAAWDNAWGPLRGWFSHRKESGDWVIEQACHTWDVLNWVAQATPLRAFALGRNDLFSADEPGRDVNDYYLAVLEYPKRFTVQFHHSWFCPPDGAFTGVYERVAGLLGGCDLGAGRFVYRDQSKSPKEVGRGVDDTFESVAALFNSIRTKTPPVSSVLNGRDAVLTALLVRLAYDREKVVSWEEMLKEA